MVGTARGGNHLLPHTPGGSANRAPQGRGAEGCAYPCPPASPWTGAACLRPHCSPARRIGWQVRHATHSAAAAHALVVLGVAGFWGGGLRQQLPAVFLVVSTRGVWHAPAAGAGCPVMSRQPGLPAATTCSGSQDLAGGTGCQAWLAPARAFIRRELPISTTGAPGRRPRPPTVPFDTMPCPEHAGQRSRGRAQLPGRSLKSAAHPWPPAAGALVLAGNSAVVSGIASPVRPASSQLTAQLATLRRQRGRLGYTGGRSAAWYRHRACARRSRACGRRGLAAPSPGRRPGRSGTCMHACACHPVGVRRGGWPRRRCRSRRPRVSGHSLQGGRPSCWQQWDMRST
jgi:hypothetical protein